MGKLDAPGESLRPSPQRRRRRFVRAAAMALAAVVLIAPVAAGAHVNSPDVFHEGLAGPYRLLVTIRPPDVIPGVAAIEVLAPRADLRQVTLVPIPVRGPGARAAPVADIASRAPEDARLFRGNLWLMAPGSWQVRIHAEGPQGAGDLAVPVSVAARRTKTMQAGLGLMLVALLAFLSAGLIGIIGVSVRDASLPAGATPDPARRRRGRIAQGATALLLAVAFWGGGSWWSSEDSMYRRLVYRPPDLAAVIDPARPGTLDLALSQSDWKLSRQFDNLLPDHGHLMHLFAVRVPALDVIAHLHPNQLHEPGHFAQALPPLPAGSYALFADVVHPNGFAETATTILAIADRDHGHGGGDLPPAGDDAVGLVAPIAAAAPTGAARYATAGTDPAVVLADGTRVVWMRDRGGDGAPAPLVAGRPGWFRFRVLDSAGAPASDVVPYMGMAGHAAFLKHDRTVFAHVHPSGSASMAALGLVAPPGVDPHAGHAMHAMPLAPEITFPYACPQPGDYRVFVQFRRADVIETAAFDVSVSR
jgi:hypothetical protein